jgi:hypothetical protein
VSIKARLRTLEGRDGPGCYQCRLRPTSTYVVYPDEEYHEPPPQHCPECGCLIEVVILKVVYEDAYDAEGEGPE